MNNNFDWNQYLAGKNVTKLEPTPKETDWNQYKASAKPEMAQTLFGELPRRPEKHSEDEIAELIDIWTGAPGMKVLGQGITKLGGKGIQTARNISRDLTPYERAAQEAATAHEEASALGQTAKELRPGQIASEAPKTGIETVEDQLGRALNIEAPHAVRVSQGLRNRIGSVEKYWNQRYGKLMDNLKNASFQMPESLLETLNMDNILNAVKSGKLSELKSGKIPLTAERSPFLEDLMSRAPTAADKNAADFVSKYKDFRNGIHELRQTAKTTSDEGLRRQLFKDIKEAESTEATIKETLEKGLGPHAAEFKEINKGYAEQIFPLRSNPIAKRIVKGNSLSENNMMRQLSGNAEGTALLREMAKQDPEIVRSILGQRYSMKPGEIHNPNELVREYLDELPEVKKLLTTKESHLKDIAARKSSTLEQKLKAESELSNMKDMQSNARGAAKSAALYGVGAAGMGGAATLLNMLMQGIK